MSKKNNLNKVSEHLQMYFFGFAWCHIKCSSIIVSTWYFLDGFPEYTLPQSPVKLQLLDSCDNHMEISSKT